ncbi:MAG: GlsB/YeaQ/YmgE family stress response membrane protein [Sphingomonadales bacterium]|nr:GlsB/YeaQ/YmgE family stress response membrane protein [Sphingomonadales bacterium]
MSLIGFLLIGLIAGFLAGRVMKGEGFGLIGNLIVGVVGAFLGGSLLGFMGVNFAGQFGAFITAFIGAVVLLWIISLIKK